MLIRGNEITDAIYEGKVLVIFIAQLFAIDEKFKKTLEKIKEKYSKKIDVYEIDVDEEIKITQTFGITTIPTVCIFDNSQPKVKIEGIHDFEIYDREIGKLVVK